MAKGYRYVECRAIGHSWDQIDDDRSHKSFGAALQFRCTRCYSVRRDVVSTVTGELLYRSYSKPDDYATSDPLDRNDWRLLLISSRRRTRRSVAKKPELKVVGGTGK
jgi:hypothetical protein